MSALLKPWNPDYADYDVQRARRVEAMRNHWTESQIEELHETYKQDPVDWIQWWVTTIDPRNVMTDKPAQMLMRLFPKQIELVQFFHELLVNQANGLVEKSRDAGLTWLGCAFSVWMWRYYEGSSIGWGSRKSELVDELGNPDSIFEKMRIIIRNLPDDGKLHFLPRGFNFKTHMSHMRIINPENGSTIKGEIGDNIGRGGRSTYYFKDESAHYEHPESIEAALSSNTNVQVDISSVHGLGNVFHRKRESGVDWSPGNPIVRGRTNVFVFDWRDDPRKGANWYQEKKAQLESEGLRHIFAQEVDRDYSAALPGVIIPGEYVKYAVDAHRIIGFDDDGGWAAALDVSDGGLDTNALAVKKGVVVKSVTEWTEVDTGATARRAVAACDGLGYIELQYDAIGVGSGIKAETNRLIAEGLMPRGIRLIPWNAGAEVLDPEKRVIRGVGHDSPLNKDFYGNLKAQGWWNLRLRFEKTMRAVKKAQGDPNEQSFTYDTDELISLPSELALLRKLEKELTQAVMAYNSKMKMIVDKQPEDTKSPNLADAMVMLFWPAKSPGPLNLTRKVREWGAGIGPKARSRFPTVTKRRKSYL